MKKNILVCVFFIGLSVSVFGQVASAFQGTDEGNGTITITKYNGTLKDVQIPEKVNGLTVGAIGNEVFYQKQITSVTIPKSVTSIGEGAFAENQLTSITLPNSVTSINAVAFLRNRLTSVTIPNGVKTIGKGAFAENQLTSITIPNSVTSIEMGAFMDNQLTSVTIGANVSLETSIDDKKPVAGTGGDIVRVNHTPGSFDNGLDTVYNKIGKKAGIYTRPDTDYSNWSINGEPLFLDSTGKGIEYIGDGGAITIPKVVGGKPVTTIEKMTFTDKKLTSVIIPDSVTSIEMGAFQRNQLTSVTIGNSVTSIGEYVFTNNKLTSVVIPNSVTSIGNNAFSGNALTSITIGANVNVGKGAFSSNPFQSNFKNSYDKGGKMAGTYVQRMDGKKEVWEIK